MMSRPSNTKPLDPYDDTYRGPNRQGITQVTDDEVYLILNHYPYIDPYDDMMTSI